MNWRFIEAFTQHVRGAACGRKEVNLCLQTNGTLVTRDIARFLRENEVGVGVSLDGIDEAANGMRVAKCGGRSALQSVIEALRILLDEGCEPGVISVVTQANFCQVPRMIEALVREGVCNFTLNPMILAGAAQPPQRGFLRISTS